jgi:putative ABC transport system substrate-binding protein
MATFIGRRKFIAALGGAATWPLAARAQQPERMRRIGWLWPFEESDPTGKLWMAAFKQGLSELGWIEGRNLRTDVRSDVRWNPRTPEQTTTSIAELIALKPDVLLTMFPRLTLAVQQQTRTIPIVFVGAVRVST